MDESLRSQIDSNLSHLDALIRRGRELRDRLENDPSDKSALVANRGWQQDCGAAIHNLSGGSKAHWLARAFSEAFLMRTPSGDAMDVVPPAEIVERLIRVLGQAVDSLSQMGEGSVAPPAAAPAPRRFDFVHTQALRPVLEQAFSSGRDSLERGNFGLALVAFCGILETIITDALEHKGVDKLAGDGVLNGKLTDWPFETRLAVAEGTGTVRGLARLPEIAKKYRDFSSAADILHANISERDARRTLQVLHVVMRDLDPGR